jgi:hypothetical protein
LTPDEWVHEHFGEVDHLWRPVRVGPAAAPAVEAAASAEGTALL